MSFEKYTEMIIKCFSTLDKDEGEKLFDQQKVNAIINGIRVQDVNLMAATSYIAGQYLRDVTMVARIHGSAQVSGQTIRRKRLQIYSGRLVTADVDADEDMEGVMEEAAEIVARVIKIAEECPTSTALIYPTPLAHLPTKNGPRSVEAVGKLVSLRK